MYMFRIIKIHHRGNNQRVSPLYASLVEGVGLYIAFKTIVFLNNTVVFFLISYYSGAYGRAMYVHVWATMMSSAILGHERILSV